ncbi:MAG: dienelactone hydrolase family protein, partial [bacterium]|nr:dienelactone hydrolase family protein [bacterium]
MIIFITVFFFLSTMLSAQNILWEQTTIPMVEAGPKGLETLLVWPDSPGKHSLALINHGSPRDGKQRAEMTAISYLPIAMEFARRGFATAVVLRRGFGSSGGDFAENYGTCDATDYKKAALAASKDLHSAIEYLGTRPQFSLDPMIAVGVSAGGFATTALTADWPPKGLVAAISFAGGRGSLSDNHICQQDDLTATFGFLGARSRVPMLWVYAENDHFFNPLAAQGFLKAFNQNGGKATLFIAPSFENEGHFLFSIAGIPTWTPVLDGFLTKQNLIFVNHLLPLPIINSIKPPVQLSSSGKKAFLDFLRSPPHNAFAISKTGAYGWRSSRRTIEEAKQETLAACETNTSSTCFLYALDN